jgi:hypothetical protein
MTTPKTNPSEHYKHFRKAIAFPFWKFLFYFILTALLNDVQTARVRTGLETHARHSPSWILFTSNIIIYNNIINW